MFMFASCGPSAARLGRKKKQSLELFVALLVTQKIARRSRSGRRLIALPESTLDPRLQMLRHGGANGVVEKKPLRMRKFLVHQ